MSQRQSHTATGPGQTLGVKIIDEFSQHTSRETHKNLPPQSEQHIPQSAAATWKQKPPLVFKLPTNQDLSQQVSLKIEEAVGSDKKALVSFFEHYVKQEEINQRNCSAMQMQKAAGSQYCRTAVQNLKVISSPLASNGQRMEGHLSQRRATKKITRSLAGASGTASTDQRQQLHL